jgi:hypothetical protein
MPPDIRTAFFAHDRRIQMLGAIVRQVESAPGRPVSAIHKLLMFKELLKSMRIVGRE